MMLSFEAWKRNYRDEYDKYQGQPEQILRRAGRVQSRRDAIKAGKASVGDGKDIHHKDGNPRNKELSNLKSMNRSTNRSRKLDK